MSALACKPTVFVVGDEYSILVYCKHSSLIHVRVGEDDYYVKNSGVLPTQKKHALIRVPQSALDKAREYTVVTERTVQRTTNDPILGAARCERFEFGPVPSDDIKIYHIADVHCRFALAKKCAEYFDGGADLYIVNGDCGEVMSEKDYFNAAAFLGELAGGERPVVFARGNHDARGKLAERFAEYFPSDDGNFYYSFSVGRISGVVFDCGEDKLDPHVEYGGNGVDRGVNMFKEYRRRETAYLKTLEPIKGKIALAVGHINFTRATAEPGSEFDIEREVYSEWSEIFGRLGIKLMLCGHTHRTDIFAPDDERSILPHSFPVATCSRCEFAPEHEHENLWGAAMTVVGNKLSLRFTDKDRNASAETVFALD